MCKYEKPESSFSRQGRGLRSRCKPCINEQRREERAAKKNGSKSRRDHRKMNTPGYIYFIQADDCRCPMIRDKFGDMIAPDMCECGALYPVKIGFTKSDPEGRLGNLQNGSPYGLSLEGVIEGELRHEQRIHELLAKHHIRGEWFHGRAAIDFFEYIDEWISGMFWTLRASDQGALDDIVLRDRATSNASE